MSRDVALPQVVNAVLEMGAAAFRAGRARNDHPFNRGSSTIITWQHGWDAAASASGVKSQHTLAALRRVDRAQVSA